MEYFSVDVVLMLFVYAVNFAIDQFILMQEMETTLSGPVPVLIPFLAEMAMMSSLLPTERLLREDVAAVASPRLIAYPAVLAMICLCWESKSNLFTWI